MAESIEGRRLALGGEPFPVAEPVDFITGNVQGSFSVSQDGTLVYHTGGGGLNSLLTWFDGPASRLAQSARPAVTLQPALSPDARTLAVNRLDSQAGTYDIWLYDLLRATDSRLTIDPKHDDHSVWSPDGSRIVFSNNRNGHCSGPKLFPFCRRNWMKVGPRSLGTADGWRILPTRPALRKCTFRRFPGLATSGRFPSRRQPGLGPRRRRDLLHRERSQADGDRGEGRLPDSRRERRSRSLIPASAPAASSKSVLTDHASC